MVDIFWNLSNKIVDYGSTVWDFLTTPIEETSFGSLLVKVLGITGADISGPVIFWLGGSAILIIFFLGLLK